MLTVPFRGTWAIGLGLVTRGRLRGPSYVRLFPDVYVHASVELTPAVRAGAAALVVLPVGGAAAGWSAAELLGASCGPWHAPAEAIAPGHLRSCPGLVLRQTGLHDCGVADGVPVTSPLRTAWDLARRLDMVEAVVAVDALAAAGRERPTFVPVAPGEPRTRAVQAASREPTPSPGFDPIELLRYRDRHPGQRGARTLDRLVALSDPRAESPPETRLRLLLVRSGLPLPQVQYRLFDGGVETTRVDLAYPEALLAIEYDGDEHDDARSIAALAALGCPSLRSAADRARDLRTAALGWHTLRLLSPDLTRTPHRTVATIRDLRATRLRLLGRTAG